ncbi:MAG TPA: HEAT repeat domain-containing protein [Herpetosiphonaceae bacterium]|nr:HEAT repeat domain-containing protein [Herpetosiphonaceae bacterium]
MLYAFDGGGGEAIRHAQSVLQSADQTSLRAILAELVRDPDPVVQLGAAEALIRAGMPDATITVLPLLQHKDMEVRAYVSGILRYGDERSIDALCRRVLTDPGPIVRCTAVTTLEEMGTVESLPALRYVSINDTGSDYEQRSIALAARVAIKAIEQRYPSSQS